MNDERSDELRFGIVLGFAAALVLVAVVWRLRGTDEAQPAAPADLDDEALLVTIQTRFAELEEHMAELYDRIDLDAAQDLSERQFPVQYEMDPEAIGVAEEAGVEGDDDFDDIDLDDEELGL